MRQGAGLRRPSARGGTSAPDPAHPGTDDGPRSGRDAATSSNGRRDPAPRALLPAQDTGRGAPRGPAHPSRRGALRAVATVLALRAATAATAARAQPLAIVPLRHRRAEDLLPVLQPLLDPGAAITGQGMQLFVRAEPRQLESVRELVARLDVRARALRIRLSHDLRQERHEQRVGVQGPRVHSSRGEGATGALQAEGARSHVASAARPWIRVDEGAEAWLAFGIAVPLRLRHRVRTPQGISEWTGTEVVERVTALRARATVAGDRVEVDLLPVHAAHPGHGGFAATEWGTRVSGRLGEWIAVGGAAFERRADHDRADTGAVVHTRRDEQAQAGVWLRVELDEPAAVAP